METPTINNTYFNSTSYGSDTSGDLVLKTNTSAGVSAYWQNEDESGDEEVQLTSGGIIVPGNIGEHLTNVIKENKEQIQKMAKKKGRIIKIYIVDPDEKMPLDQSILYQGEEIITDATDQELFFGLDIKGILEEHNIKRGTVIDKKASERRDKEIYLEPIRIRDLTMNVLEIASF